MGELQRSECASVSSLDENIIVGLREMARRGESVAMMFKELTARLGSASIVTILDYMRTAFHLSLTEAKPIGALSRMERREIVDEALLNKLVMPEIEKHRSEWDRRGV
jgi:DNA integrity scanning protein DisA with diadenylate cyclase activity